MEQAPFLTTGSTGDLTEVDYWLFGALRARSRLLRVLVAGADDAAAARLAGMFRAEGRPGAVAFLAPDVWPGQVAHDDSVHDYIDCDLRGDADPIARLAVLAGLLVPGGGMRVVVATREQGGCDIGGLFDLLATVGLVPVCLIAPLAYDPAVLEADPAPCIDVYFEPDRNRAGLAESRAPERACHVVYAHRRGETGRRADPMDPASVPVMHDVDGFALSRLMRPDNRLPVRMGGQEVLMPVPSQARGLLPLIDGRRTVGDLMAILDNRGVEAEQFRHIWRRMFASFAGVNRLLLRASP